MKISKVKPQSEYVKFQGGLDLATPYLTVSPGALIGCLNYEAGVQGGYRRIDGYERFSGKAAPSDASYYVCFANLLAPVMVGQTITGVTSSATGVISQVESTYFCITAVANGPFVAEAFTIGGVAWGTLTAAPKVNDESTGLAHAIARNAAADIYRGLIAAPTGSGAIRGIEILNGTVYCFRDNAGGTAGVIYKATTSGWSAITLYHEISFASGVATIPDGTAISQVTSGATAVVKRTVLESGAWGSTAAGRLIIGTITGTFDATHEIQVGGVTKVTASSLATAITILPGGRYETVVHNFYASTATKRIYGCDGVNRGFEFDGTVYVPLKTGMATDTPEYVIAYGSQLFFSFKGSSQNCGAGTPYEWTAVTGALEIGLGDNITGYARLTGSALGIFSRNSSNQLLGNNVDGFTRQDISDEVGAIPRTVQKIGYVYCLDDRGIVRVVPTDTYGNFEQSTISRQVQSFIDEVRSTVVASTTYKARNQYRLYCNDGMGLCMTLLDEGFAFTRFKYPVIVSCVKSGEDVNGKDVIYFGATNGMVYQADKGSSFDGEEIEAFILSPYNHSESPSVLKSYLNATIEMTSTLYSAFRFDVDFSYGTELINESNNVTVQGGGGFWDVNNWDEFFYDLGLIQSPTISINGSGSNISITIYSKSDIDLGHVLNGIYFHFIPRRLIR